MANLTERVIPSIRHNEVRDITTNLLNKVAHNVAVEPHLQPVTGEQIHYRTANAGEQARMASGIWGIWGGRFERTFIDVRLFNPYASSNRTTSLATSYARQERKKGVMSNGFGRLKMHHLSLLFLRPLEEWANMQLRCTNVLHPYCRRRPLSLTTLSWQGYAAE